ncbi:MAG: lysylphosphatidylglycerol synthase transmembrane domain-containing protein [Gemmatimonadales bacterium]|nr:lysylphosphatidylglycerol synthase transmembrane domain-containing protein [Gemmatimonadales bacterium]
MKNKIVAGLLGVAVSVALLVWVLKDVSFTEVLAQAREAHIGYLLLAITVTTSTFVIRIFRWRLILQDDHGRPLDRLPMWHAIAIGFMANNLLPFRAGEFLRAFAINRLAPVKVSSALSSLVVERLFDGIAIVILLFVGLMTAGIPASTEIAGIRVADVGTRTALVLGGLLVVCGIALALPELARKIVRTLVPARGLAERLVAFYDGIRGGLGALASPGKIIAVLAWSLGMWTINASSFFLGYHAFDIAVGFGGALLQQSILILGIAAPSSPGYVGVFEGAIKAVLSLFGVDPARAVAFALTYHFTTFIPITALGLFSLVRTGMSLKTAQETARST